MDRHLDEWGTGGGRLLAFNGQSGIHRTLADDVEVPSGTEFDAFLHLTQRGFINFNTDDGQPDVRMVRIDENAVVPARESLGDNDPTQWPVSPMNGAKNDPWKEQFAIPMARHDQGGELFIYIARGIVAMNSVRDLLGRWRHHPKRREGLIPVVAVINGTYYSKRFNDNRPKPELTIVGWVMKTGAPPPQQLSLSQEMKDELPSWDKEGDAVPDLGAEKKKK